MDGLEGAPKRAGDASGGDGMASGYDPIVRGSALLDVSVAGGKAAALARLMTAGGDEPFPVPAFFVVRADAVCPDGGADGMSDGVRAAIGQALATLGDGPFAVRSSGVEEDGAAAAHAGQYDTLLNVAAEDVLDAIVRVWRSGEGADLARYRAAHGMAEGPSYPAVLVQCMVEPRAAGVGFSVDPVSGDDDVVAVAAVAGLADDLVSGVVTGDQYWVAGYGDGNGNGYGDGDIAAKPPVLAGDEPVLSGADLSRIAALARRAQAYFGCPQDIEWAMEGERLYLLQSRPITTLVGRAGFRDGDGDDGVDDLIVWDNANIVESYPGIVSPLTFSFAAYVYAHVYKAFARLLGVSAGVVSRRGDVFEQMLGHLDGRVYYHLLNWYRALALMPGFHTNRAHMEGMMGAVPLPASMAEKLAPSATHWWQRVWDRVRLARTGFGLFGHALALDGTIARFYARLDAALAVPDAQITDMDVAQLARAYRQLEADLLARWDAPLVNDFLCMIAFGAARGALVRWAGDDGARLHGDVLIGQGDIISAEPAQRIKAMGAIAARAVEGAPGLLDALAAGDVSGLAGAGADLADLRAAFEGYLAKFGDRCAQELKLESVTLHDDPAPLARAVGAAARARLRALEAGAWGGGHGGDASDAAPAFDFEARLAEVFAGRPVKRALARWVLNRAKGRVRDRENLRFERTRVFGRVRRIMLALGRHWADAGRMLSPRDVFLLTIEEVLAAAEGDERAFDAALLEARRAEMARWAGLPDPANRLEQMGGRIGPAWRSVVRDSVGAGGGRGGDGDGDDPDCRTGLACCVGVVRALARVVEDPRTQSLEPGEVLVARHTDPGWIGVFANAAGVIAERGSLLSHSAIVAREMGVPCVVALADAAHWISTGDLIELDGGAGVVRIIKRAADAGCSDGALNDVGGGDDPA